MVSTMIDIGNKEVSGIVLMLTDVPHHSCDCGFDGASEMQLKNVAVQQCYIKTAVSSVPI